MNQLRHLGMVCCAAAAAVTVSVVGAHAGMLDTFNEYSTANYIQGQQGTSGTFARFGSAVADGLYASTAAGSPNDPAAGTGGTNIGAVANASFGNGGRFYFAQLNFTSPMSLSTTGSGTVNLDIQVTSPSALPNTMVAIQIQEANGQQYESAPISLGGSGALTYQTYSFNFSLATTTYSGDPAQTDSLATVLANASALNIFFSNTVDTGAENIDFDDLGFTSTAAVPEPSTGLMALVALVGAILFKAPRWSKARSAAAGLAPAA